MSENIQDWLVVCRIIGSKLPRENIYLEDVYFRQIPLDAKILRPPILKSPIPGETGYGVTYSHVSVKSDCYIFVRCQASSADAAKNKVYLEQVPILQTCLSLRDGGLPYQVEFAWIESRSGSETFSPVVSGTIINIEKMSSDRLAQASADYRFLFQNDVARSCARRLSTAIQQQASSFSPAEREATLLSYFKVIERIANSFKVSPEEKARLTDEKEEIITDLQVKLKQQNRSLKIREQAIEFASNALDKLDRKFLSLRIEHAASQLNLSNDWLNDAIAFNKMRNTQLGHHGENLSHEAITAWLTVRGGPCLAHKVACDMLTAYVAKQQS